jgi:hypothetical protein
VQHAFDDGHGEEEDARGRGRMTRPESPASPGEDVSSSAEGMLEAVNDAFRGAYGEARAALAVAVPTLVATIDALYLCRGPERLRFAVAQSGFHAIKAAAHAPVAIYVVLSRAATRPFDAEVRERLDRVRAVVKEALDRLPAPGDAVAADMGEALRRTLSILVDVTATARVDAGALEAFAAGCGPVLERLTVHGTRAQLASLDAAVQAALGETTAAEREALHVVVTGDHQARVRSLAMQYFRKRLEERPGDEERVTFAEAVSSVEDALALVATCRLDRTLASAFFGDPRRLQRDVLGDAAASLLKATALAPIGR